MGGGTETVKGAQVVGLSKKFGTLKKKILLENGKFIASGMGPVIKSMGQSIVDLKSLYNKKYLEAMGYAPNDSIEVDKISEGKILEYTKNNIDSRAAYVTNPVFNTLGALDQAILELQDKTDFKRTEMSFTHTDNKKYYYYTAVQNGPYIDISCYMDDKDTVIPYLENKYPDGYAILDMNAYPLVDNGRVYWKVEVEYVYYEDEIVEEEEIIDGEVVIVQNTVTYQKLGLVTESIDCIFIYFTVLDEEEAQMYALAQQHSGPFSTNGSYTYEETKGDGSPTIETVYVTVNGTFTVTYIGNGNFSYNMNAPVPISLTSKQKTAWNNGVTSYKNGKMTLINQAIANNIRKLIWDYGTDREDMDSLRRTFVLGNTLQSFIVKEQADSYPIIPLKRNFNFVNGKNMDLVLKKIGIEGKDFHDSIRQPEVCDAYLFFGVPFSSSNPGLVQYIFEFFTTLSNVRENYNKYAIVYGSASVNISFDGMGLIQNYTVRSQVVIEPATRPVGTYWTEEVKQEVKTKEYKADGYRTTIVTYTYHDYFYQESEAYHIRIRPIVQKYSYILGGEIWGNSVKVPELRPMENSVGGELGGISFKPYEPVGPIESVAYSENVVWGGIVGGANEKIELRLPILKQITNKMKFNLLCDVIEQSMSLAVYTEVEVKTKWYQTGFFKFVVGAILIVFQQYWLFTIMVATTIVTAQWGHKIGGVFQIIVTAILLVTQNYGTAVEWNAKQVLITAAQVVSIVDGINNLMFGIEMEKRQDSYNSTLNAQEQEKEKLEKEYAELYANDGMSVNMFNNVKTLDDISAYFELAVGNFDADYLMFEYATDYDKFYKT